MMKSSVHMRQHYIARVFAGKRAYATELRQSTVADGTLDLGGISASITCTVLPLGEAGEAPGTRTCERVIFHKRDEAIKECKQGWVCKKASPVTYSRSVLPIHPSPSGFVPLWRYPKVARLPGRHLRGVPVDVINASGTVAASYQAHSHHFPERVRATFDISRVQHRLLSVTSTGQLDLRGTPVYKFAMAARWSRYGESVPIRLPARLPQVREWVTFGSGSSEPAWCQARDRWPRSELAKRAHYSVDNSISRWRPPASRLEGL
jgi:hypothetical protein